MKSLIILVLISFSGVVHADECGGGEYDLSLYPKISVARPVVLTNDGVDVSSRALFSVDFQLVDEGIRCTNAEHNLEKILTQLPDGKWVNYKVRGQILAGAPNWPIKPVPVEESSATEPKFEKVLKLSSDGTWKSYDEPVKKTKGRESGMGETGFISNGTTMTLQVQLLGIVSESDPNLIVKDSNIAYKVDGKDKKQRNKGVCALELSKNKTVKKWNFLFQGGDFKWEVPALVCRLNVDALEL